jgi:hypothetical protein
MAENGSVIVSSLKLVTKFNQNLVCKVVANVNFVPVTYISPVFTFDYTVGWMFRVGGLAGVASFILATTARLVLKLI